MSQPRIRQMRRREEMLRILIPKFLGIFWDQGYPKGEPYGLYAGARLGSQLELAASYLRPCRFILSAWSLASASDVVKVFSAHVTFAPEHGDPEFFRYLSGTCGLLGWRRGHWEELIEQADVSVRSVDTLEQGLLGPGERPTHCSNSTSF